jgi:hypothetical protein
MSISELIAALVALRDEFGDLTVYVNDTKEDVVELPHDWVNVEQFDGGEARVYIG